MNNKRALITGAGKGIGRSIAIAFARNGADICAVSRTREDVESLARQISQEYDVRAVAFQGDVSSAETVRELARKATSVLGEINVLVCAAGLPLRSEIWEKSLHELEEHHFLEAFQIDVMGSFLMAKELLPSMMNNKSGVIILFSSTPAVAGYHKGGSYTVAKAANLGLVKEIASEYGQYNIRAYAIAPGNIRTERTFSSLSKTEQENLAKEAPMKRWGEPDEVATVAVSLASENMSFVTGQTIVVDGGTVML